MKPVSAHKDLEEPPHPFFGRGAFFLQETGVRWSTDSLG